MAAHLFRRFSPYLPPRMVKHIVNLWSPFLGAGIKLERITSDFRHVEVSLDLRWYNTNYVGVHFGGSIYAMTDPFYMLMLLENLGKDYIVWDKGATIDFAKPGRGRIHAVFHLDEEDIAAIKRQADAKPKHIFTLPIAVLDEEGDTVASIKKNLYVKRKDAKDDHPSSEEQAPEARKSLRQAGKEPAVRSHQKNRAKAKRAPAAKN